MNQRHVRWLMLVPASSGALAGCGETAGDGATIAATGGGAQDGGASSPVFASTATCPPEPVTLDERGAPRNAAGQIRHCWPGEAHCYCDSDNDCYAQDGYVACTGTTAPVPAPTPTPAPAPAPTPP